MKNLFFGNSLVSFYTNLAEKQAFQNALESDGGVALGYLP
jgi:hypothetical protein